MRKLLTLFFAVIAMAAVTNSQDISSSIAPLYDGPVWGSITDTGITCSGGPNTSIIRDDGSYENGYRSVSTGDSTTMVQKMVMPVIGITLTQMCVTWTSLSPGGNITFDLIFYDTTGAGGSPGNVVYRVNNVVANSTAIYPAHSRYSYPINFATTQRAYYVGVRWNNNPILPQFFSADENGPASTMGPGYQRITTTYPPVFTDISLAFPLFKSWGVRLEGVTTPVGCSVPELMYYRWENNTPTTTPNTASAPVGTVNAPYTGTIGSGGMYDTCMVGTGATGTTGILPGWNCNLGTSNWTIGFWVKDLVEVTSGNPVYLFGDPGSTSFRCFYGGFALPNNAIIRGPFADVIFACPMPGSHYFHIVYNGTALIIYRNGVQLSSTPMTITLPTGTGFRVAGYTGGAFGLNAGGRMDEFRLYNRAITPAEITASWNKAELPACLTAISQTNNNEIPNNFSLSQNYPNPFNPTTNIKFAIPSTGLVKLVVFDVLGREVKTLVNEVKVAGNYTVDFNASELSSGVYFYRIDAGNFTQTKKMLLVK